MASLTPGRPAFASRRSGTLRVCHHPPSTIWENPREPSRTSAAAGAALRRSGTFAPGGMEAGKLKGRYMPRMDLEAEAARGLAAPLLELADRAG